jgi:glycosyltransferase involved in cell wall biosynthesis
VVSGARRSPAAVETPHGAPNVPAESGLPDHLAELPSIPLPFQHEYRLPSGLSRTLKREILAEPDTLIHLGAPDTLAVSCLRFARKHNVPVVTSFHSNIVAYFRFMGLPSVLEKVGWAYFRWFYGNCDQVYVPTDSMRSELERHSVRANYLPWPRGVDRGRFSPAARSGSWRSELGIGPRDVVVLFVARLRWEKNLKALCRIIERLHAASRSIATVIVGEGVAYDYLVRSLPETRFTGRLTGQELAKAYASSDIFLYPSTTDTFGNVTLEAMASGLPAVCADAPGSRSLVQDGVNGYLVDPESLDAFGERILRLANDEALRARMSTAALESSRRYDWDSVMRCICAYYDDLYRSRHAGAKD